MTSMPIGKGGHFSETVESNQWVKISPIIDQNKKYRNRSGAFAKPVPKTMSLPVPAQVTKGFVVMEPTERPIAEGTDECLGCQRLQEEVDLCTDLNDSLLKKFSRIIQLIDKGKKLISGFEQELGIKTRPDLPTNPVFVESQSICLMDEDDKQLRRESGLDYLSVDLTSSMFPPPGNDHAISVAEFNNLSNKLCEYLEDCREISLSSANLCFESRFGFLQSNSPGSVKRNTIPRPPLQRMHTLSSSSVSSTLEHSLELGSRGKRMSSQVRFLHHGHSEQKGRGERMMSLRRTRSDDDIMSNVESRVLLMEGSPIDPLHSKEEHSSIGSSQEYCRVFSNPGETLPDKSHDAPFRSHLMSVLKHQPSISESISSYSHRMGSLASRGPSATSVIAVDANSKNLQEGLTGEESMHLLDKISTLEQQRLSLLTELETMKEKNNTFWETLKDLREEIDEKDLYLNLLTADVRLVTREINNTNERRKESADLRRERDLLMERLRNLEDEGKAVKDSLVQLVTEKAATNKALTLENQRLRQKVKRLPNQSSQTTLDANDGDMFSAEDEFRMQGLFAELNDGDYVHKQGFLVKQGHKMKNWKRRMFVLDTHSLSYYKTEQPLGSVPLEEISRVQISHSSFKLPFLFEIHRNDPTQKNERVYYLSAPTHDEMQSWMGIIQTLKDTKRQSLRHSMLFELETSPIGSPEKPEFPVSSIGKNRSLSIASHSQNSLTLPVLERQHKTVRESGVRNRMFTDTGQRRTDIPLTMDTSDEEDTRSPLSISSDDDISREEGSFHLKCKK